MHAAAEAALWGEVRTSGLSPREPAGKGLGICPLLITPVVPSRAGRGAPARLPARCAPASPEDGGGGGSGEGGAGRRGRRR